METDKTFEPTFPILGLDRLRRTKSMPKHTVVVEQPTSTNQDIGKPKASTPKTDCFVSFNRAKSKLFNSYRIHRSKVIDSIKCDKRNILCSNKSSEHHIPVMDKHRASVISETGTIDTHLSFKVEEYVPTSTSSTSPDNLIYSSESTRSQCGSFNDAFLEDMDEDISVPILPPRSCSSWQKSVHFFSPKNQQLCTSPNEASQSNSMAPMDITSFGTSPNSQCSISSSIIDEADEDNFDDVRVYPVVQNGVKMSDTHYWIINAPPSKRTHRLRQHSSQPVKTEVSLRGSTTTGEERLSNGHPSSFMAKLQSHQQHYINISSNSACSSPEGRPEISNRHPVMLRRGRSELGRGHLHNYHRELVEKLRCLVPLATEVECEAVLIGSGWMFDDALKRLKLELVCRTGYAPKPSCQRLLEKLGWSLDATMEHIKARKPYSGRNLDSLRYFTFDGNVPSIEEHPVIIPSILVNRPQLEISPTSSTSEAHYSPEALLDFSFINSSPLN